MKPVSHVLQPAAWRRVLLCACLAAALPASAQLSTEAGSLCGALDNAYGPFDYITERDKLQIVERAHFTPNVEQLRRGSRGTIGGDLDYTLRASPNHHRALVSMMRYGEKLKQLEVPGAGFPVECYFDRALRFRRNDTVVRALYATFLQRHGRLGDALKQLDAAVGFAGNNAFSHYNLGLVYLEFGKYDKALAQAHRAMALGFERTDLRDKLKAAGKWVEPPVAARPSDAPASDAADAASAPRP